MKVGKKGKAAPHAAYIVREGQYAKRLERGEKLEATEAGNMPAWAKAQPQQFWHAADVFERVNGTTYREMEIALPRELDPTQRAGGQARIKPVLTHKPFGYVKRLLYFKSKLNWSPVVFPAVQQLQPALQRSDCLTNL